MCRFNLTLLLSVFVVVINQSSQSPTGTQLPQVENVDVDFACVANATCVKSVANKVVRALQLQKAIDFGAFMIEPKPFSKTVEGRSMTKLMDLANNNKMRIPIGSYSLSLKKSEDFENYFEVAVSKTNEGKKKISIDEKQQKYPFLGASKVQSGSIFMMQIQVLSQKHSVENNKN